MLRRNAHIRAREAAVSADDFPSSSVDDTESNRKWCCCGGRDDGRLMLNCDRQREGCCVWYHYDCLGFSLTESQRLGSSEANFVCPNCSNLDTATPPSNFDAVSVRQNPEFSDSYPVSKFKPCTDFLWNDVTGERACEFFTSTYEEVIHWKPNIFLIPFGKAGKLFVQELARLYQAFAEDSALG